MATRPRSPHSQNTSFEAFLSHRYKSHDINLYFFKLFSDIAEVQFRVDEGVLSTSVTRLERMVREADAFIGIYPFPGSDEEARSPDALLNASRYFRLELDLAIRSRKPGIVFSDVRYGSLLRPPASMMWRQFDAQEVTGTGGSPRADRYRKAFEDFSEIVQAWMAYQSILPDVPRTDIAVALPWGGRGSNSYSGRQKNQLEEILASHGSQEFRILEWPPLLNRQSLAFLGEVDWVLVDHGEKMAATGLPSYLHGQFVPMVRTKRCRSDQETATLSPLEAAMFGGLEVGYRKDMIAWSEPASFYEALAERLTRLNGAVRRIKTWPEAEAYFSSAALRPEAVFLSYSGQDQGIGRQISEALKKRFVRVFDYRDGESIEGGRAWLPEIFNQLVSSSIGVPLLSANYLKSGNCMHEAAQMVAQVDSGKMVMVPILLEDAAWSGTPWLESTQYVQLSKVAGAEEVADKVVKRIS